MGGSRPRCAQRCLYRRHTEEQRELLLEFSHGGREFNELRAALVEERNRPKRVS